MTDKDLGITVTADIDDALDALSNLQSALDNLPEDINPEIDLDDDDAQSKLDDFNSDLENINGEDVTPDIELTGDGQDQLDDVQTTLDDINGESVEPDLELTGDGRDELNDVQTTLDDINGESVEPDIEITGDGQTELDDIQSNVNELNDTPVVISTDVSGLLADGWVASIQSDIDNLNSTPVTIDTSVTGDAEDEITTIKDDLTDLPTTQNVEVDLDGDAETNLPALQEDIQNLPATTDIEVNEDGNAETEIDNVKDDLESIPSEVDVAVDADTSDAESGIENTKGDMDDLTDSESEADEQGQETGDDINSSMLVAAGGIGTAATAASQLSQELYDANTNMTQLANDTGESTTKMTDLINSVTTPEVSQQAAESYIMTLMQLGEPNDLLEKNAEVMDKIQEGTGASTEAVQGFAQTMVALGMPIQDFSDSMGIAQYEQQNFVGGLENYSSLAPMFANTLESMGFSYQQASVILADMSQKTGGTRKGMMQLLTNAGGSGNALLQELGTTDTQVNQTAGSMDNYSGTLNKNAQVADQNQGVTKQLQTEYSKLALSLGDIAPELLTVGGAVGIALLAIPAFKIWDKIMGNEDDAQLATKYVNLLKNTLVNPLKNIGDKLIPDAVSDWFDNVTDPLKSKISNLTKNVDSDVTAAGDDISSTVKKAGQQTFDDLFDDASANITVGKFKSFFNSIVDTYQDFKTRMSGQSVLSDFETELEEDGSKIEGVLDGIKGKFTDFASKIKSTFTSDPVDEFQSTLDHVFEDVDGTIGKSESTISKFFTDIKGMMDSVGDLNVIQKLFPDVDLPSLTNIESKFSNFTSNIKSDISDWKSSFSSADDDVIDLFQNLDGTWEAKAPSLLDKIKGYGGQIKDDLKNLFSDDEGSIDGDIGKLTDNIQSTLNDALNKIKLPNLSDLGSKIPDGITDGITSKLPDLSGAIDKIPSSITEGLSEIKLPSLNTIGESIPSGVSDGVKAGIPKLLSDVGGDVTLGALSGLQIADTNVKTYWETSFPDLFKNTEPLMSVLSSVLNSSTFKPIWDSIKAPTTNTMTLLGLDKLTSVTPEQLLTKIFGSGTVSKIEGWWDTNIYNPTNASITKVENAITGIVFSKDPFGTLYNDLKGDAGNIESTLDGLGNYITKSPLAADVTNLWNSVKNNTNQAGPDINNAIGTIKTHFSDFESYAKGLGGTLKTDATNAWDGFIDGIKSQEPGIGTELGTVKTDVMNDIKWIEDLPGEMETWGKNALAGFIKGVEDSIPGLKTALDDVKKLFPQSPPSEGPLADITAGNMSSFASGVVGAMGTGITTSVPSVSNSLGSLSALFPATSVKSGPLTDVNSSNMGSFATSLLNGMASGITANVSTVQNSLGTLAKLFPASPAELEPLASVTPENMENFGSSLMVGLASGITSGTPAVTSALNVLVSDVNTAVGGMGGGVLHELSIGGVDPVTGTAVNDTASSVASLGSNSSTASSDLTNLATATQTATAAVAQSGSALNALTNATQTADTTETQSGSVLVPLVSSLNSLVAAGTPILSSIEQAYVASQAGATAQPVTVNFHPNSINLPEGTTPESAREIAGAFGDEVAKRINKGAINNGLKPYSIYNNPNIKH